MTYFSLRVKPVKSREEYEKLFDSIKELDLYKYVFDKGVLLDNKVLFDCWEDQKWPDQTSQMLGMSIKFPDKVFELFCHDDEDYWKVYYKNGLSEICDGRIVYEEPTFIELDNFEK